MEEISYEYLRSLGPLCQKDIDDMLRLRITSLTQCFEQPLAGEMDHPKNSSLYPRGDHRLPFDFAPLILSQGVPIQSRDNTIHCHIFKITQPINPSLIIHR